MPSTTRCRCGTAGYNSGMLKEFADTSRTTEPGTVEILRHRGRRNPFRSGRLHLNASAAASSRPRTFSPVTLRWG